MAHTRRLMKLTVAGALAAAIGLVALPLSANAALAPTQIAAQEVVNNFQSNSTEYYSQLQVQSTPAANVNVYDSAVAQAHCANCKAESVSFQIVFLQNSNPNFTEQSVASSSTPFCRNCGALAVASQFILSVPPGVYLTQAGVDDLNGIRQDMASYYGTSPSELLSDVAYWHAEVDWVLRNELTNNAPAIQIVEPPYCWQGSGTL